ncbi:5'-nucleotidase C-terminal domain-containing protein [Dyadobacter sp. CY312]|uniref:5'-nucleotidase C-terminal domain-containing protein n=1 Tax=Dyadobacter sp. CY312 TaxID=2907303 RepID=UPI001F46DDCA|nr:5'-nucleotidase C-terminal domain-containing protein [Dyadobacter sp. CY312]MCE7038828.1 5'-nucleotidase C-terminal domain-containing protein [Dyadobacter sp. CY312]
MNNYKSLATKLSVLWIPLLLNFSCNKHFTLKNTEYKQYGMSSEVAADSSLIRYYTPFKQKMESEMNRVVGEASGDLIKSSDPETSLGNFYADAILAEAQKIEPAIEFSFPTTKGGIRNSIPKGAITVSHVFELMPFDNEMVILKLSGTSVQKMIDYLAASNGQPVSGIRMKVKDKKAYEVTIGGKPFDVSRNYLMVTSDYIANNGDDQSSLANPLERRNAGKIIRTALLDYIGEQTKNGKKIIPQTDGRIIIDNK